MYGRHDHQTRRRRPGSRLKPGRSWAAIVEPPRRPGATASRGCAGRRRKDPDVRHPPRPRSRLLALPPPPDRPRALHLRAGRARGGAPAPGDPRRRLRPRVHDRAAGAARGARLGRGGPRGDRGPLGRARRPSAHRRPPGPRARRCSAETGPGRSRRPGVADASVDQPGRSTSTRSASGQAGGSVERQNRSISASPRPRKLATTAS